MNNYVKNYKIDYNVKKKDGDNMSDLPLKTLQIFQRFNVLEIANCRDLEQMQYLLAQKLEIEAAIYKKEDLENLFD